MKASASLFFASVITTSYTSFAQDGDWISNWSTPRTLVSAFDVDPEDARSMMRGSGDIVIGDGIAKFFGSPRMYISHDDPTVEGWDNVEITAYGKYVNKGTAQTYSGLTLVTRSNHDAYASDGCSAFSLVHVSMKKRASVHSRKSTSMVTQIIQFTRALCIPIRNGLIASPVVYHWIHGWD